MSQSDIINSRQIQWFPGHMTKTLRLMEKEIRNVDCVLQILDARIPLSSLNPEIERITAGKPHLYILNKADLADPEITKQWLAYFKSAGAGCLAMDSKQRGRATAAKGPIEKELSALMARRRNRGMVGAAIRVMVVGIPNVGKSTLFNRLIRSNRAITHDRPGVTRDRMEGVVRSRSGRSFTLIDTGGVTLDSHHSVADGPEGLRGFEAEILQQTQAAMDEASVFCLVVDGRDGLMPFDEHLASFVRRAGKPTLLVVNKVDGMEHEDTMLAEFHALGFPMLALSAEHGHNIRALEEEMVDLLPVEDPDAEAKPENVLRLAMLGRPNAGKSSLVNAMIGEDRMIVSDVAGTTRDSVDIPFVSDGRACEFVDTAGVRRRTRITDTVERFSVNSSLKTTTKADVTLYVIDALEGVTAQDKRLIDLLDERKTPFMILVNKIDLVGRKEQAALEKNFKEVLQFCPHVPVLMVSAMKQVGLGRIVPLAAQIREECNTRIGTGALNRAMEEVLTKHQPPVVKRSRPKFFYLTQAEVAPPTFVFFVSDADRVSETYARYLDRSLRKIFRIEHAPIRVRLRSSHKKKGE